MTKVSYLNKVVEVEGRLFRFIKKDSGIAIEQLYKNKVIFTYDNNSEYGSWLEELTLDNLMINEGGFEFSAIYTLLEAINSDLDVESDYYDRTY